MAQLFNDSKTFVDMKLKESPERTMALFRSWQQLYPSPTVDNIRQFVVDNFDPEGSEFVPWTPLDHVPVPEFLSQVADRNYYQFGQDLHDLWLSLGRKISDDVRVITNKSNIKRNVYLTKFSMVFCFRITPICIRSCMFPIRLSCLVVVSVSSTIGTPIG